MEKTLKLDRPAAERFYTLYREQYNPELSVPNSVVEEWIAVGTFRAKDREKGGGQTQRVHDWTSADTAKTVIGSRKAFKVQRFKVQRQIRQITGQKINGRMVGRSSRR